MSQLFVQHRSQNYVKKFHGHHMLSLSLYLSLSLLTDADPESFDSDNVFVIFHVVLVDEGREDPDTTKAGCHRPASETPFDGLGSSREL